MAWDARLRSVGEGDIERGAIGADVEGRDVERRLIVDDLDEAVIDCKCPAVRGVVVSGGRCELDILSLLSLGGTYDGDIGQRYHRHDLRRERHRDAALEAIANRHLDVPETLIILDIDLEFVVVADLGDRAHRRSGALSTVEADAKANTVAGDACFRERQNP
ncbi:MAG: hypothetical protein AAGA90_03215 [Actinomycetota bacterium]